MPSGGRHRYPDGNDDEYKDNDDDDDDDDDGTVLSFPISQKGKPLDENSSTQPLISPSVVYLPLGQGVGYRGSPKDTHKREEFAYRVGKKISLRRSFFFIRIDTRRWDRAIYSNSVTRIHFAGVLFLCSSRQ